MTIEFPSFLKQETTVKAELVEYSQKGVVYKGLKAGEIQPIPVESKYVIIFMFLDVFLL